MKVNLYYAPYPSQIFADSGEPVNTERPLNPKSALPTLAAGLDLFAERMGFECDVEIVDMQLGGQRTYYKSIPYGPQLMRCYRLGTPFEAFEEKIREADIHGLTCDFTNSAQIVGDLAEFIKRISPRSLVVAGGVDASARPSYFLSRGADVVVKGEGEYVFSRVVDARMKGLPLEEIPNVVTPGGPSSAKVDFTHTLAMDELRPMRLDLVGDLSVYTDTAEGPPPDGVRPNFICFETSRGCAWRCSFCTAPSRGSYRFMSPAAVEKHFAYFKSVGINTIVWQEDNPLSRIQESVSGRNLYDRGRDELLEIFSLARDYGFAWEFANGIEFGKFRRNGKFDHELMASLLWSDRSDERWRGCYRVQIPLDNLNLEEKIRFPKLRAFEEQLEILACMLTDYGVGHQTYDLFIGYPEHTPEVVDTFARACLRIRDELSALGGAAYEPYFNVFNLSLLPGARDFDNLHDLLAFDVDRDPEVIGIFLSAINTAHFSYYDIFQRRVAMTNLLNDADMVRSYDGIYTGHAVVGSAV